MYDYKYELACILGVGGLLLSCIGWSLIKRNAHNYRNIINNARVCLIIFLLKLILSIILFVIFHVLLWSLLLLVISIFWFIKCIKYYIISRQYNDERRRNKNNKRKKSIKLSSKKKKSSINEDTNIIIVDDTILNNIEFKENLLNNDDIISTQNDVIPNAVPPSAFAKYVNDNGYNEYEISRPISPKSIKRQKYFDSNDNSNKTPGYTFDIIMSKQINYNTPETPKYNDKINTDINDGESKNIDINDDPNEGNVTTK